MEWKWGRPGKDDWRRGRAASQCSVTAGPPRTAPSGRRTHACVLDHAPSGRKETGDPCLTPTARSGPRPATWLGILRRLRPLVVQGSRVSFQPRLALWA